MSRRLQVSLYGDPVGELVEAESEGSEFRFLDSYRELTPRPVLGQRFEDDLYKSYRSRKRVLLPDFFANLIPETGRLRDVIIEMGGLEAGDDLAILTYVGQDLPGAVTVRPEAGAMTTGEQHQTGTVSNGEETPDTEDSLRFSLAGVQLKFSMLLEDDKLTLPARGHDGEWIVKLDSSRFTQLPQNEYSMLRWARRSGFEVPDCHLLDADKVVGYPRRFALQGTEVLAVRRYDRTSEGRVHQEDFAQAVGLPPAKKYDHVTYEGMARLARTFIDEEAAYELVRRLVFTVACGNGDAHLKNWSLLYPDRIRAAWSPLYDQVATVAWPEGRQNCAGVKAFHRLDRGTFERLADRADLGRNRTLECVDEVLERLRVAWGEIGGELPLPSDHLEALLEHWQRVPLLREAGPLV